MPWRRRCRTNVEIRDARQTKGQKNSREEGRTTKGRTVFLTSASSSSSWDPPRRRRPSTMSLSTGQSTSIPGCFGAMTFVFTARFCSPKTDKFFVRQDMRSNGGERNITKLRIYFKGQFHERNDQINLDGCHFSSSIMSTGESQTSFGILSFFLMILTIMGTTISPFLSWLWSPKNS